MSEGRYRGAQWNDGDFYKWIEAVCAVQAVEPDPEWDRRLDDIIAVIGKAQRDDGYIHTPVLIAARNGDATAAPFADRFNFEMYNMGHLMTAACRHHEVTGKATLLDIARKAADFLDSAFRRPTQEQARHAICPSHYMGIIDLYRTTGESRYLELAQRLISMRDLVIDGGDDNQDRVPFVEQSEAVGHAVRATYLYAGLSDLFAENRLRRDSRFTREDLAQPGREEDVHHWRMWGPLRWRIAGWIEGPRLDHSGASSFRTQLPAPQYNSAQ